MTNPENRVASLVLAICAIVLCATMVFVAYKAYYIQKNVTVLVQDSEIRSQQWVELKKANPKVRVPELKPDNTLAVPPPVTEPKRSTKKSTPKQTRSGWRWPWSK